MSLMKGEGSKPVMSQGFKEGRRDWGSHTHHDQVPKPSRNGRRVARAAMFTSAPGPQTGLRRSLLRETSPARPPSPLQRVLLLPDVLSRRICKAYRCCRPGEKECFIFFILRKSVTYVSFLMLPNAFHLVCIVFCVCGIGVAF